MPQPAVIESLEARQFLSAAPSANLRAVTGTRDLLYVRVRFDDQAKYPLSADAARAQSKSATDLIADYSGGNLTFARRTKAVALPEDTKYYKDKGTTRIADHADVRLKAAGFDLGSYEHIVYRFDGVPGSAGIAQVGGKRVWMRSDSGHVLTHELGHNLGLGHARLADPKDSNPFGAFTADEYGDPFTNMGRGGGRDWNAGEKRWLGWLAGGRTKTIDASRAGKVTVDLSSHDDADSYASSRVYLVRVKLSSTSFLNVEFRKGLGGVLIQKVTDQAYKGSLLIDATPNTESANDAALKFGKSVSDKRGIGKADDVKIAVVGSGSKARVTVTIGG